MAFDEELEASADLSILPNADGSAVFSEYGYRVIGSVNGPIEVLRRDEIPDEATIEVLVRPANGIGGVCERYLEGLIHSTLRHIILVQNHPRTLIQITLQIAATPENEDEYPLPVSGIQLLPALLQTSILALLSTSLPLSMTFNATAIAANGQGEFREIRSLRLLNESTSIHVFAFSSHGGLLLAESEGEFDFEDWTVCHDKAKLICLGPQDEQTDGDEIMGGVKEDGKHGWIRRTLQEKVARDQSWKYDASDLKK